MSRNSTSVTNMGSTHVALGFLTGLVSFDFGLTTVSSCFLIWLDTVRDQPVPTLLPSGRTRSGFADFTYIWTAEGWLYVSAVIDLFSRRVVGWSMSASMTAQLVADALLMAVWRRGKPDALMHHSDRGQYASEVFQRLMADSGLVCNMSRSGNVWDNAAMESFFSSLKTERIERKTYRTRNDAEGQQSGGPRPWPALLQPIHQRWAVC
jgi:transposase InsO family protein